MLPHSLKKGKILIPEISKDRVSKDLLKLDKLLRKYRDS